MRINRPNGDVIELEPETSDQHKREIKAIQRQIDQRDAKTLAQIEDQKRKARAAMPTESERRAACVAGLTKLGARHERAGNVELASIIRTHAKTAEAAHAEYARLSAALASPRTNPLTLAAADVAKGLMKSMPGAFTDADEAAAWAVARLPLSAARKESTRQAERFARTARERHDAHRRFWAAVSEGARLATGEQSENEAMAKLMMAGM